MASVFITGVDTGVGKTIIAAWLCLKLASWQVKYWKPIQTGKPYDEEVVKQLSPETEIVPSSYYLKEPLSPYDAARLAGMKLEVGKIVEQAPLHKTVIEGAGGVLVPVAPNFFMIDLIARLKAKVIVVASSRLGCLNHLNLTAEALSRRNLEVLGVIMVGETELVETIEQFTGLAVLQVMPIITGNLCEILSSYELPPKILEVFA